MAETREAVLEASEASVRVATTLAQWSGRGHRLVSDPLWMMEPIEAHMLALELMKRAGFVLVDASMKSEACYYRHPSRDDVRGVVRISLHSRKKARWSGLNPVVSKVTVPPLQPSSANHIFNLVANAIGRYFLADEVESRYLGSKRLGA
jgi:hypothetical protein